MPEQSAAPRFAEAVSFGVSSFCPPLSDPSFSGSGRLALSDRCGARSQDGCRWLARCVSGGGRRRGPRFSRSLYTAGGGEREEELISVARFPATHGTSTCLPAPG